MSDLLADASDWLCDTLESHASRSVAIQRGGAPVTVNATIGQLRFQTLRGSEFQDLQNRQWRDFLIDAAEYDFGPGAVEPERGDRITDTQNGTSYVYEVAIPGDGEPHWRWTDRNYRRYRIHAVLVDTE